MLYFSSLLFFSLSNFYTVSSKHFSASFAAKSRNMAKNFVKQRVSDLVHVAMTHEDNRCVKITCSKASSSSDIIHACICTLIDHGQ